MLPVPGLNVASRAGPWKAAAQERSSHARSRRRRDPALEQARLAQLAPRAYADAWLCRYTAGTSAPRPAPPAQAAAVQEATPPVMQLAAQARAVPRPGAVPTRAEADGAAAADGAMQAAEAKQAARPKPVPPPRSGHQREAARLKALRMTAERKRLRDSLQAGEETLEQALARADEMAGRMRTDTLLRALPGIGGATATRLMREAGIDAGRRAGALTAGQRERLWPPWRSWALSWPLVMATAWAFKKADSV